MSEKTSLKLEVGHSKILDDRFGILTVDVSAAKPQPIIFVIVNDTPLNLQSTLKAEISQLKKHGAVTIFDIYDSKKLPFTTPGYLSLPEILGQQPEKASKELHVVIYITNSAVPSSETHIYQKAAQAIKQSSALFTIGYDHGYDKRPLWDLVKVVGRCGFHQHATCETLGKCLEKVLLVARQIRSVKLNLAVSCLDGGRVGQVLQYWPFVADLGYDGKLDLWKVLPNEAGQIKVFLDLPRAAPEKIYITGQSGLGQKWNFTVPFPELNCASSEDIQLYEQLLTANGVVTDCASMASKMAELLDLHDLAKQIAEAGETKATELAMVERMRFYFLDNLLPAEDINAAPMLT